MAKKTQRKQGSDNPKLLTTEELAKHWGCSAWTLSDWRIAGKGPKYIKIGGLVRYRIEDIHAYERAHMKDGK